MKGPADIIGPVTCERVLSWAKRVGLNELQLRELETIVAERVELERELAQQAFKVALEASRHMSGSPPSSR